MAAFVAVPKEGGREKGAELPKVSRLDTHNLRGCHRSRRRPDERKNASVMTLTLALKEARMWANFSLNADARDGDREVALAMSRLKKRSEIRKQTKGILQ